MDCRHYLYYSSLISCNFFIKCIFSAYLAIISFLLAYYFLGKKGLSFVCNNSCLFKLDNSLKFLPQTLQQCIFFPSWTVRMCLWSPFLKEKFLPHASQWNSTPSCTFWLWWCLSELQANAISHFLHLKFFSPKCTVYIY